MTGTGRQPHVLVVAYDFPPHAAIGTMRTLRVVREMASRGWQVSVLTGDPASYLPGTPVDEALLRRVPGGVRIIRAGALRPWKQVQAVLRAPFRARAARPSQVSSAPPASPVPAPRSARPLWLRPLAAVKDIVDAALAIPDRESGWILPAIARGAAARFGGNPPDVIYSSAPPWSGQVIALGLKMLLRRPWVADFRDPWARAPWRGDRYRFAMGAAGVLERLVVRGADRVIFVASANRDDFARQYGAAAARKFIAVSNGCDPAEFDALRGTVAPEPGPHVMLHAGSLYGARSPVPLFRALADAIRAAQIAPGRFRLRLLGVNALKGTDLVAAARDLGLEEVVEFVPRVPREQSLRAMMSASSLLLLQPGHTISVPGKVYEYLAAGRPIFAIAEEGETAEVVRGSGAGISVRPDDEHGMRQALVALVNGQLPVAAAPRASFDGTIGASAIADVLHQVHWRDERPAPADSVRVQS